MSGYVWTPNRPLRPVERHVDFQAHHDHVTDRRANVERLAKRRTKRLVYATVTTGYAPLPQVQALATTLETALYRTAVFGYQQVQREVLSQRAGNPQARWTIQDAGGYGRAAREGLTGVRKLIRHRAQVAASAVAAAAANTVRQTPTHTAGSTVALQSAVGVVVARTLHNNVLELVGETLNLGRASGAMSMANPPEYALRSEQLDKATCEICDELHGEIAMVDSSEYYDLMPPTGCLGGGRCRGIMIYADSADQMAEAA